MSTRLAFAVLWTFVLFLGHARAADVWLDSVFGPPDTVVGCTSIIRFGAYVHTRYPATGRVYFLLDSEDIRIYEDDENFDLLGGDSLLLDWPLYGLGPGRYVARDSLSRGHAGPDSGEVRWEFWVIGAGVSDEVQARPCRREPAATLVRGVLFLAEASSRRSPAASLLDLAGREVMDLDPGANDVSFLVPGVYFIRETVGGERSAAVRKVVIH